MINNSAAVQSLAGDRGIAFIWRKNGGKPDALWKPSDAGAYYWPGDAANVDGKLYVFLHVIKPKPQAAPPFQFETTEDVMMRVENPLATPLEWSLKLAPLGNRSSEINFGVACWVDDKYFYSFCSYPSAGKSFKKHPTIVARINKRALAELDMSKWEYWCRSTRNAHRGQWQRKLARPLVLVPDGAPEMSVSKMRNISGLLATYMPGFSRKIFIRHSMNPAGPWSKPVLAYTVPETEKGILLYSAKAHPEQPCGRDELVVTYCRNSEDFAWHISRPEIYFPQAVIVRLRPIGKKVGPRP